MAIEIPDTRTAPSHATGTADGTPSEPPFRYSMYGVQVGSDVRLPLPPLVGTGVTAAAWEFRRAASGRTAPAPDGPVVATLRCDHGTVIMALYRGPGGAWIWNRSLAMCHIPPDARRVDIYPEARVDERTLGLVLVGPVAIFVLHQLGFPVLHASAVLTERGAVAFLGPKGQGKSTMAAYCLRRGATLLTDDALPLQVGPGGIKAAPGLPLMKVWRETAECALALTEELPNLTANFEKKLLALEGRYTFAPEPAPLRAIYVLDRYDPHAAGRTDITVRPLSQRDGIAALVEQTALGTFLHPLEGARLLPRYARLVAEAPVHVLSYPDGFEHQAAVFARIMAELEGRR